MKARSKILVFLVVCIIGLGIFGLVRLLISVSRPEPALTVYLSRHELVTPSNSDLYPEVLQKKLALDPLQAWMLDRGIGNGETDDILREVLRYLTINITLDLPDDPLVKYTHYYYLEIINETNRLFEDVYIQFPFIESVDVRRKGSRTAMASLDNGRYIIGDIGPDDTVDVYAWNNRPFYFQEEDGIIMRQGNERVEIIKRQLMGPQSSWVKNNIILVVLLGGLVLFLLQKMFFVIRLCSGKVDPKLGKKISLE